MINQRPVQQLKCVSSVFDVYAIALTKEQQSELLTQHYELQKMHTKRNLRHYYYTNARIHGRMIKKTSSEEFSSLESESDLEEQIDAEQKAKKKADKAKAKAEKKIWEFHNMPTLANKFLADPMGHPRNMNPFFSPNICQDIIYNPLPMIPKIKKKPRGRSQ